MLSFVPPCFRSPPLYVSSTILLILFAAPIVSFFPLSVLIGRHNCHNLFRVTPNQWHDFLVFSERITPFFFACRHQWHRHLTKGDTTFSLRGWQPQARAPPPPAQTLRGKILLPIHADLHTLLRMTCARTILCLNFCSIICIRPGNNQVPFRLRRRFLPRRGRSRAITRRGGGRRRISTA